MWPKQFKFFYKKYLNILRKGRKGRKTEHITLREKQDMTGYKIPDV